jgi:hypothetical protein
MGMVVEKRVNVIEEAGSDEPWGSVTVNSWAYMNSWRKSIPRSCGLFHDCRLIECSDLTIKNGNCDPFAIVTMCYSNSKQESKRTKVKKKTVSPHFDEVFVFEVRFDFMCLWW